MSDNGTRYAEKYKISAVKLSYVGQKGVAEVARDLGISFNSLSIVKKCHTEK